MIKTFESFNMDKTEEIEKIIKLHKLSATITFGKRGYELAITLNKIVSIEKIKDVIKLVNAVSEIIPEYDIDQDLWVDNIGDPLFSFYFS